MFGFAVRLLSNAVLRCVSPIRQTTPKNQNRFADSSSPLRHPVYIFVASLLILFLSANIYAIVFLGLGLGCMLDEFIASLMMPGDRPLELRVSRNALSKTTILLSAVVLLLILMTLLFGQI